MTFTELCGLMMLTWCLLEVVDWLRLRRDTTPQRRVKQWIFRRSLFVAPVFIVFFFLSFLSPPWFVPPSWAVIGMSLVFLIILGIAMNELRIAFRARNASPADSNT